MEKESEVEEEFLKKGETGGRGREKENHKNKKKHGRGEEATK
jgi:hypothetical protein